MRDPAENPYLWKLVQGLVYPHRWPSDHPPFAREECSPKRKRASWLYYTLLDNPLLRIEMRVF